MRPGPWPNSRSGASRTAWPSSSPFALVEDGRRDDAAIALHAADNAGFGTIPDDLDWPVAVALWSEVATRTGDRHAAAQLLSRSSGPTTGSNCPRALSAA